MAERVGIVGTDETQPLGLDDGDDGLVDVEVGSLPEPACDARAPEGVHLGDVRHAQTAPEEHRVLDVVPVVPARGALVARRGGREEHVRAHVAHLAIGGAGLAPVGARVGDGDAGAVVEGLDVVEVGAAQGRELGDEEGVEFADRVGVPWREAGAAVGVVAEDGRDADEFALVEGAVGVFWHNVFVDHGVPHEFGGALAAMAFG
jgi:hypothetical protein